MSYYHLMTTDFRFLTSDSKSCWSTGPLGWESYSSLIFFLSFGPVLVPDSSVCMAHHKFISIRPCYSKPGLASLWTISPKRYEGQWEGHETGGCFAFLAGLSSKIARENEGKPCSKDQEDNEPNELSTNIPNIFAVLFQVPHRLLLWWCPIGTSMPDLEKDAGWYERISARVWGDLLRQAMKDVEGEGADRRSQGR